MEEDRSIRRANVAAGAARGEAAAGRRLRSPWLGDRRGAAVDWATQRWVQLTGRRLEVDEGHWLDGPYGSTDRIGADFFSRWASERGLEVMPSSPDAGLMPSLSELDGPGFDSRRVHPLVRDFYEHTAAYRLDIWSQWSGFFRPFGEALAWIFSRRLQQLNVPLAPLDSARGMGSEIVRLVEPGRCPAAPVLTGWVRRNLGSGSTVYVGAYSTARIPGHPAPCVKVVFPLPNGSATVIMKPSVADSGALVLESSGRRIGDAGFYFRVRDRGSRSWVRYLRTFRERIRVYAETDADSGVDVLRTDHTFTLWRRVFLRLHYRMARG
ncbi:MAG: hypothetical protein DWQ36_08180 [Acidobacteria bacterium]|nr:MAG: hypothetical protein DWQ36_08180 [Acidobacteriota bacterium]